MEADFGSARRQTQQHGYIWLGLKRVAYEISPFDEEAPPALRPKLLSGVKLDTYQLGFTVYTWRNDFAAVEKHAKVGDVFALQGRRAALELARICSAITTIAVAARLLVEGEKPAKADDVAERGRLARAVNVSVPLDQSIALELARIYGRITQTAVLVARDAIMERPVSVVVVVAMDKLARMANVLAPRDQQVALEPARTYKPIALTVVLVERPVLLGKHARVANVSVHLARFFALDLARTCRMIMPTVALVELLAVAGSLARMDNVFAHPARIFALDPAKTCRMITPTAAHVEQLVPVDRRVRPGNAYVLLGLLFAPELARTPKAIFTTAALVVYLAVVAMYARPENANVLHPVVSVTWATLVLAAAKPARISTPQRPLSVIRKRNIRIEQINPL
ncbi:hypothetical protein McanCB49686_006155 [Microsporum canis]